MPRDLPPSTAGKWTHLTPWGASQNAVVPLLKNGVPLMSPETTDEEKRGKGAWRESCGPAQQVGRERHQPKSLPRSARRPRWSWSPETQCSPSSSVVSGDIRGTYPLPRVYCFGGKLRASLLFVVQPDKPTVSRVGDCQRPRGGAEGVHRLRPAGRVRTEATRCVGQCRECGFTLLLRPSA